MRKSLYRRHNEVFLGLLRRYREQGKLRQRDLAQHLGSGQGTVSKAETGLRRLDVIELREWLLAMGVDFLEFMSELHERLKALNSIDHPWLFGRPAGDSMPEATLAGASAMQGRLVEPGPAKREIDHGDLETHATALAAFLLAPMRTALLREVADTMDEFAALQIRGRSVLNWLSSVKPHADIAALFRPDDSEIWAYAHELAQLLLSNWVGLLAHAAPLEYQRIIAQLRCDPAVLPIEVTSGCDAFPLPEDLARNHLAWYLKTHWRSERPMQGGA